MSKVIGWIINIINSVKSAEGSYSRWLTDVGDACIMYCTIMYYG